MTHWIETVLYRRGLVDRDVRTLVRNQLYVAGVCCAAALALGWVLPFLWFLAAGALLATWNFFSLVLFVQGLFAGGAFQGARSRQLIRFYGRLLLTGVALFALIVYAKASVPALVAGLSSVVLTLLLWGGARGFDSRIFEHKVKEA